MAIVNGSTRYLTSFLTVDNLSVLSGPTQINFASMKAMTQKKRRSYSLNLIWSTRCNLSQKSSENNLRLRFLLSLPKMITAQRMKMRIISMLNSAQIQMKRNSDSTWRLKSFSRTRFSSCFRLCLCVYESSVITILSDVRDISKINFTFRILNSLNYQTFYKV